MAAVTIAVGATAGAAGAARAVVDKVGEARASRAERVPSRHGGTDLKVARKAARKTAQATSA